ncbi:unnamed protein product [Litomosoides sigmodontis]|uniref:Uncharacterized protein n=1 Tax=Litomosoides sigmodontis TaxID=42156 RepID=A0A3P6SU32_LITSI|nr:unnamed protein product [Litomosoides sigmodontis]
MASRFGFHTNHFGISEEELEYDENDPSWCITSPGANVLQGSYESAKPFIEKIRRQQCAYLEEKVEERRELRQAIRERVLHDFDEKLKQHMAKFQPRPRERLVLELFLAQQKKELEESFWKRLGKRYVPESECVLGPLANISGSELSHNSVSKPALLAESISTALKSQLPTEPSVSVSSTAAVIDKMTSNMYPTSSLAAATSPMPTIREVPSIGSRITSFHVPTAPTSPLSYSTPIIQQQLNISPSFVFCPQKSSTPTSVSSETLKSGHATLTRTDSVSSCRSSASRSTSWPLQQIVEEQSLSNDARTTATASGDKSTAESLPKLESLTVSSTASNDTDIKTPNHQIYGCEIAFARTFMANTADINDTIKNELKCTIKEKISVSTKKFAKRSDIDQIVSFFSNLLNGLTVHGFNDKMVNLKDDGLARNWAMVHIIDTYMGLVSQDISLLRVVAAILSLLASSSITFSKLLYGKLFIASSLLAVNHNQCLKHILDLKNRSERFAETMVAWHSREVAIISLFIALKMSSSGADLQATPGSHGLGLMWKMIAVTAADNSAFGATLITEILKQYWTMLHKVYGRQMEKLVILINRFVLPHWRASLTKTALVENDSKVDETVRNVAENYLTSLRFTIDDCLLSFRS